MENDNVGQAPAQDNKPDKADVNQASVTENVDSFSRDYVEKLRAENAQRRVENNQLKEQLEGLAQRFDAVKDNLTSDMTSQIEQLTEKLNRIEQEREAAQRHAMRLEVAGKFGLKPEIAERLRGETLEELQKDAEYLASLLPSQPAAPRVPVGLGSPPPPASRAKEILQRASGVTANPFDVDVAKANGGGIFYNAKISTD